MILTTGIRFKSLSSEITVIMRTSDSEHFEPGPVLEDPNKTYNTDDSKGKYGELFCQLVHAVLEWGPPLLDILHHTEDDTELSLGPGGDGDTRATTYTWFIVNKLPTEA